MLDVDPVMAANIANGIVTIVDSIKTEVQRRLAKQVFTIVEFQYQTKDNEIRELTERIHELGQKGVYDFQEQSKTVTELAGRGASIDFVKAQQKLLVQYGAEAQFLHGTLKLQLEELAELKKKYDQAKVDVEAKLSNVFIISSAMPAEKKSYPIRWLIVLVSVFGSFVLGCLVLLFVDKFKKQDLLD